MNGKDIIEKKCGNCGKTIYIQEQFIRDKMYCTLKCLPSYIKSKIENRSNILDFNKELQYQRKDKEITSFIDQKNKRIMSEFIGKFLCAVAIVMIIGFEFITEKLTISKHLEKDRKGIIDNIIISIFMTIFAIPMIIFMKYSYTLFMEYSRIE